MRRVGDEPVSKVGGAFGYGVERTQKASPIAKYTAKAKSH
jgi:hypothetical protein